MLINCPECELQVSDKAISCPHCGYPFKKAATFRQSSKRKRLPNGFGQISLIKNKNLRNPYRVMVSIGKNAEGRPIQKLLQPQAYFKTYNEAYSALVEYNKNPYSLSEDLTIGELYEKWYAEYKTKVSLATLKNADSRWNYLQPMANIKVRELKTWQIKECIENASRTTAKGKVKTVPEKTKRKLKELFNMLLDYAVEYELVEKNVAKNFVVKAVTPNVIHSSFTDDEMNLLWENITEDYVDAVLIQCYMGWRPGELCNIKTVDVDLENRFITGGLKTKAGTNRIVPIHDKIFNLVKKRVDLGNEYLFTRKDSTEKCSYGAYNYYFQQVISKLGLNQNHKAHDPRKHFVTQAKKAGMDEYAIKRIVGHAIADITESTYTDRDPEWLKEEMKKIK